MTLFPDILTRRIKDIDNIIIEEGKRIKCDVTNTYPFVLHASCNANMDDILIKLGYKNCKSNTTFIYLFKKEMYHIKLVIKIFLNY